MSSQRENPLRRAGVIEPPSVSIVEGCRGVLVD